MTGPYYVHETYYIINDTDDIDTIHDIDTIPVTAHLATVRCLDNKRHEYSDSQTVLNFIKISTLTMS